MKNKKLNLNELKVKSFVTDFDSADSNTIKGGGFSDNCQSDGGCMLSFNCETINGFGDCNFHTAHNCSVDVCYSNYCNSGECGGPASDRCMV